MLARMGRFAWCLLPFLALGATAACSASLAKLDEEGALSEDESLAVRAQVEKAVAEKRWESAWNQEVAAGGDRHRLELIALAALRDESGDADDMFEALHEKWKGITPAARQAIDRMRVESEGRDRPDWDRALEIELVTADDPPAFKRAWDVYKRADARAAEDLLERLQEARKRYEEKQREKAEESGG